MRFFVVTSSAFAAALAKASDTTVAWIPLSSNSRHFFRNAPQITVTDVVPSPAFTSCKFFISLVQKIYERIKENRQLVWRYCFAKSSKISLLSYHDLWNFVCFHLQKQGLEYDHNLSVVKVIWPRHSKQAQTIDSSALEAPAEDDCMLINTRQEENSTPVTWIAQQAS